MKTSALLTLLGLLVALSATAGPGHDHDHDHDAPAATASAALPRFAASSELFELVGVLDGKTLTLYLDRAATNEPLTQAALELELGGQRLQAQAQADGSFRAELAQALGDGVHPVTATLSVGDEADLLAGELDLHAQAAAGAPAHAERWRWGLAAAGVLAVIAVLAVGRRRRALRREGWA